MGRHVPRSKREIGGSRCLSEAQAVRRALSRKTAQKPARVDVISPSDGADPNYLGRDPTIGHNRDYGGDRSCGGPPAAPYKALTGPPRTFFFARIGPARRIRCRRVKSDIRNMFMSAQAHVHYCPQGPRDGTLCADTATVAALVRTAMSRAWSASAKRSASTCRRTC